MYTRVSIARRHEQAGKKKKPTYPVYEHAEVVSLDGTARVVRHCATIWSITGKRHGTASRRNGRSRRSREERGEQEEQEERGEDGLFLFFFLGQAEQRRLEELSIPHKAVTRPSCRFHEGLAMIPPRQWPAVRHRGVWAEIGPGTRDFVTLDGAKGETRGRRRWIEQR